MKNKLSVFEIVWYSITGAVTLWGLTYIVLGLIANYAPVSTHDNVLLQASNSIANNFNGLGFFEWGLIIMVIGVAAATVVLLAYASKVGKTSEKAARRAARLAKVKAEMEANETK